MAAFGCDIGNGFSNIAFYDGISRIMIPVQYNLIEGMPSAVYVDPLSNEMKVFDSIPAEQKYRSYSENILRSIKTRFREDEITIPGMDKKVSVDKLYSAIVRDLIKLGNERRRELNQKPIYEITMTYPAAYYDNFGMLNRMQNAVETVNLDGHNVKVVGRLPEPAAAAIDYIYSRRLLNPNESKPYNVMVYDLGHGTFDVAVVSVRIYKRDEGFEYENKLLLQPDGDAEVGGQNFDQAIIDYINEILKKDYNYEAKTPNERENIREAAVIIKHELTEENISAFSLALLDDENLLDQNITITRADFEKITEGLLDRTLEITSNMIDLADEKGIEINNIIVTGGAGRMPMVINGVKKLVQDRDVTVELYRTSEAVACGASIYATSFSSTDDMEVDEKDDLSKDVLKGGKKYNGADSVESVSILTQYTQHEYGVMLSNGVNYIVKENLSLPLVSDELKCVAQSSDMKISVYRTKGPQDLFTNKDINLYTARFSVEVGKLYKISIHLTEDRNISVILSDEEGNVLSDGTGRIVR